MLSSRLENRHLIHSKHSPHNEKLKENITALEKKKKMVIKRLLTGLVIILVVVVVIVTVAAQASGKMRQLFISVSLSVGSL